MLILASTRLDGCVWHLSYLARERAGTRRGPMNGVFIPQIPQRVRFRSIAFSRFSCVSVFIFFSLYCIRRIRNSQSSVGIPQERNSSTVSVFVLYWIRFMGIFITPCGTLMQSFHRKYQSIHDLDASQQARSRIQRTRAQRPSHFPELFHYTLLSLPAKFKFVCLYKDCLANVLYAMNQYVAVKKVSEHRRTSEGMCAG